MFGTADTNRELQSLGEQEKQCGLHCGQEHVRIQRVGKEAAEGQIPKPRLRGFGG